MANIKSAKKRINVTATKTAKNRIIKSQIKTAIRSFEDSLAAGELEEAKTKLKLVEKTLQKAATKGTVHKANASRKVSRLATKLNKAI